MFSRHELAWLSSAGWDAAIGRAQPGERQAIEQWRRQDWPAIVRRADTGLDPDQVCLGIPLPPAVDGSKGRIALRAPKAEVARRTPPLALAEVLRSAPSRWQASLAALEKDSSSAGTALHLYGSLAMQAITSLPYVTSNSDIDLLFVPANSASLRTGLALLEKYVGALPLDGEIVFPSGAAVAWKEWLSAEPVQARVLVKEAAAVRLASIDELLSTFGAA
jgi:phosphoribosyl-dephospho-CoA transferase